MSHNTRWLISFQSPLDSITWFRNIYVHAWLHLHIHTYECAGPTNKHTWFWYVQFVSNQAQHALEQGCQTFLAGKNIQNNNEICTKWQQNIPNCRKIHRPNGHKIYQHLSFQDPPKFPQNGIFGLKICHLATLLESRSLFAVDEKHVERR
jgi:hypothetical protein